MMSTQIVRNALADARRHLESLLGNDNVIACIDEAGKRIAQSLQEGGKAVSCGNGGSMCDAIHFAEELSGRYRKDRRALAALSISDPAHISCVANDFGYDYVFSRFIEAHGKRGDCLVAISTSGSSRNVLHAVRSAKAIGMTVIGLTGAAGSPLDTLADVSICTPAGPYADRVQELHIKILHILIELIESKLGLANME